MSSSSVVTGTSASSDTEVERGQPIEQRLTRLLRSDEGKVAVGAALPTVADMARPFQKLERQKYGRLREVAVEAAANVPNRFNRPVRR